MAIDDEFLAMLKDHADLHRRVEFSQGRAGAVALGCASMATQGLIHEAWVLVIACSVFGVLWLLLREASAWLSHPMEQTSAEMFEIIGGG